MLKLSPPTGALNMRTQIPKIMQFVEERWAFTFQRTQTYDAYLAEDKNLTLSENN